MHSHCSSCIYYFNNFFSLLCLTLISILSLISTHFSLSLISTLQSRSDSPSSSKSQASKTKMTIARRRSRAPWTEFDWRVSWERRSTSLIQQSVQKRRWWRKIDWTWRTKLVTTWTAPTPPSVPWGFCLGPRSQNPVSPRIKTMRVVDDGV